MPSVVTNITQVCDVQWFHRVLEDLTIRPSGEIHLWASIGARGHPYAHVGTRVEKDGVYLDFSDDPIEIRAKDAADDCDHWRLDNRFFATIGIETFAVVAIEMLPSESDLLFTLAPIAQKGI